MDENKNITHSNVSEHRKNPPAGYDFSKKKMTQMANKRLHGYWTMTANYNEVVIENNQAAIEGKSINTKYQLDYLQGQSVCFNYLRQNGFLKLKK